MYQEPTASTSGRDRQPAPAALLSRHAPSSSTPSAASTRSVRCLASLLLAICLPGLCSSADDGGWRKARGTHYGSEDDLWNIHEGSCGYGYLDRDHATGWDIAAMSDANYDYSGSCGRCMEVRCDSTWVSDNYGGSFDRTQVCRDSGASVIVQITDTCPCNYPANAYSNKRWCCGDNYHLDLSTWAFEKLAEDKWGVMGIEVRDVSCDHQPDKRAQSPPEGESRPNNKISRPDGWTDRRPWP